MKTTHLLFIGMIAAFSSCSTAYRSGQTPDDVYYSPAPAPVETYVTSDNQQDRNAYGYTDDEDQDIRRGIQDPRYRNDLSSGVSIGLGYGYSPYSYSPFGGYGYDPYGYSPYGYSSYGYKGIYDPYGYNSYYSPYYSGIGYGGMGYGGGFGGYYSPIYSYYPGIGGVTTNTNVGPRRVNLAAFNSATANRINQANQGTVSGSHPSSMPVRAFGVRPGQSGTIERQQGSGVGNVIRRVFTPSESRSSATETRRSFNNNNQSSRNDNNSRTYTPPARTFDNTPSSNTSSTPAASSSAPVRTFRK